MRVPRVSAAVLAVAMSVLVAACDATPAETPSPSPSAELEPTPEPTSEPTVDPHPALGDLIITTSGLGPLTVGEPPVGNPGEAMIEWDEEFCALDEEIFGEVEEPGRWVPSGYGPDVNYMGEPAAPAFYLDADDSAVYRIDVMGQGPHTEAGIRIGSPLADLQAAYPDLQGPFAGPVSQVWWIQDANGSVAFETQGDADGMLPPGTPEGVILIRVLAPGIDPAFAAANSGNVAGACF